MSVRPRWVAARLRGPAVSIGVSQIAASASSFLFSVALIRSSSLEMFGALSVCLMSVVAGTMVTRSVLGQELLLARARVGAPLASASAAVTCAVVIACATAVVAAVSAQLLGLSCVSAGLLAFGGFAQIVFEGSRFALAVTRIGLRGATVDMVRAAVLSVLVFATLIWSLSVAAVLAVWLIANIVGIILARKAGLAGPRSTVLWVKSSWFSLRHLILEVSVLIVAGYALVLAASHLFGLVGLGQLRTCQVLLAPVATALMAIGMSGLASEHRFAAKKLFTWWLVVTVSTTAWATLCWLGGVGERVTGDSWTMIEPLFAEVLVWQILSGSTSIVLTARRRNSGARFPAIFRLATGIVDPAILALIGTSTSLGIIDSLAISQALVFICLGVIGATSPKWLETHGGVAT